MKLNWGQSIAVFYILFMIIMISMVISASRNRVQLVQENYYKKDLNYEAFRVSRSNGSAVADHVQLQYDKSDQTIQVRLPDAHQITQGVVQLYRPSDRRMDATFELLCDANNEMKIAAQSLALGLWRVQVTWQADETHYHIEKTLML